MKKTSKTILHGTLGALALTLIPSCLPMTKGSNLANIAIAGGSSFKQVHRTLPKIQELINGLNINPSLKLTEITYINKINLTQANLDYTSLERQTQNTHKIKDIIVADYSYLPQNKETSKLKVLCCQGKDDASATNYNFLKGLTFHTKEAYVFASKNISVGFYFNDPRIKQLIKEDYKEKLQNMKIFSFGERILHKQGLDDNFADKYFQDKNNERQIMSTILRLHAIISTHDIRASDFFRDK